MSEFLDTSSYLLPPSRMRLKNGEDRFMEEQAAALLAEGRAGVTALSEKRDYLTKDQWQNRLNHEVFNQNGFCDESLMSGMFRRAHNELSGSRPARRGHIGEE